MEFPISRVEEYLIELVDISPNEFIGELKIMSEERRAELFKKCCFNAKLVAAVNMYESFKELKNVFDGIENKLFEHSVKKNHFKFITWIFIMRGRLDISDDTLIEKYECADEFKELFRWLMGTYGLEMKKIDELVRRNGIGPKNSCFIAELCEKGYKIPKEVIELKTRCSSSWINEMKEKGYVENNLEQIKKELLNRCNELMEMIKNMK